MATKAPTPTPAAAGDDALAAGMDVVIGSSTQANTIDDEINKTRDYIAQKTAAKTKSLGVAGTGSSDVQADLQYLNGQISLASDAATGAAAAAASANANANARLAKGGDTMTGPLYLASVAVVTTSYAALYRNGDGRVGLTPSALKYKRDVADYDGHVLELRPVTYVLKDDPLGTVRVGLIAEEVNGVEPMLVVHEDGQPESVKYELLAVALLKEVQRLAARVTELEEGTR